MMSQKQTTILFHALMTCWISLARLSSFQLLTWYLDFGKYVFIHIHRKRQPSQPPFGLYEFRVMPFGLNNAPSVSQRPMQQVLSDVNPDDGPRFVTAYIDDLLIFSSSLRGHLEHLYQVIRRLREVGLKVNPAKCQFIRKEVQYLGHVITPEGLYPNRKLVEAAQNFASPNSVQELKRFMGLASYYRRFVSRFAKIANPLHHPACKAATFQWSEDCQAAFSELKKRLTNPPVLAYPNFDWISHWRWIPPIRD